MKDALCNPIALMKTTPRINCNMGFSDKKLGSVCFFSFPALETVKYWHIAPSYIIYASSRCILNIDYSVLLGTSQKVTLYPWISRGKMTARCLSACEGWNEKDKLSITTQTVHSYTYQLVLHLVISGLRGPICSERQYGADYGVKNQKI